MENEPKSNLQPFETTRMPHNPLDDIKIGDFYWVKDNKGSTDLMCVEHIGSNFVKLSIYEGRGSSFQKVHFDDFMEVCEYEPNWRDILNTRMANARQAIQVKTAQLIKAGQDLCLIPQESAQESTQETQTLLPARVSADPKQHKVALVALKDKLPIIRTEIKDLSEEFSTCAKNLALPDLVKLEAVEKSLGIVHDRIFTIELYCGILEEVVRIAEGEPAPVNTKIAIRQQMLFMDEETLFDYESGGMDFNSIEKFDAWVVKPENLNRILPEKRGIVAFRVRRERKDYGEATDLPTAWAHASWAQANKQTYLLLRNGDNVYRIASELDFTPRLIPKINEIGKEQFTKIDTRWVWDEDTPEKKWGTHRAVKTERIVTPDDIDFDNHVAQLQSLLKHYNRIVILIQGLLDRSMVFHPHVPINLMNQMDMEQWIDLIRDEERALPSNMVNWEDYQKQLNSTLCKGKWVYVDPSYDEGFKGGEDPNYHERRYKIPRRRGWAANRMPDLCVVDSMRRDGSAIRVSWPWGQLAKAKKERWIPSPTRPGWGRYEYDTTTDRMCHEWIPINRVLNVSDYTPGDYKMFICDRALQGKYNTWAKYLLTAEDWSRERAKGIPPDQDQKAQVQSSW